MRMQSLSHYTGIAINVLFWSTVAVVMTIGLGLFCRGIFELLKFGWTAF